MSVLTKIATATRARIAHEKTLLPLAELQARLSETRQPQDFAAHFSQPGFQVIAEVKLASPSQGDIAPQLSPTEVAADYLRHGATALSVLTEPEFFKGQLDYLSTIRAAQPQAPLLMKDFILDPYQLYQARIAGADACLLIVAMLESSVLKELHAQALALGLTPLVEVHNAEELTQAASLKPRLLGVNNRDLKTLKTRLETSKELAPLAPAGVPLICESGLVTGQDLKQAQSWGYHGFLIGTSLMRTGQPGQALAHLLKEAHHA
ncbi:indole-3-glycerol phosphate synthase [bacterium (Candidatus Blackallbacteria) CG17_big_fil_post_rev_8_21_14_2_50_48_46]|uniref:Indole-3-glycerol phosphate synthase n=1 Tax=bacterium (Candidatus Blackallbacteria) CG17_big_fil_post_rev_8_21_14_2_50_48_46 TaxID=2014261 RepID=A0A2M7FYL1_9BACT|nr:MAG: indole-3-glycerol phosphate synthase [bacterium (Candidatus Blackallbacteria) CG18_big_fil_WC_8_21_14_2_50_49_26]PIW14306.1 MAG: indole-3-glycerol phosphate synthase [bacterium (Candidatus Blackallbacteria) CG17_big_fil_post_rev_8_21_14_2_50_48_46]PIW45575.1 MAG: indole-3-glycerol phosphate synthase [bacterium (Candidatus Blackallbacteria) CG13_big_fil_rev_8_21_14_2_50_49_14]